MNGQCATILMQREKIQISMMRNKYLQAHGGSNNVIILTKTGQKALNEDDWSQEELPYVQSPALHLPDKKLDFKSLHNSQRQFTRPKESLSLTASSQLGNQLEYSKKVQKRMKQWNSSRLNFSSHAKRVLERKRTEKCKELLWSEETMKYRSNITEILQTWTKTEEYQKQRKQERLSKIKNQRYALMRREKKAETSGFEERSFYQPVTISYISYGKEQTNQNVIKLGKKHRRIYNKIINVGPNSATFDPLRI